MITEQFKILTGMRAMSEIYEDKGKKYLTNDVNPFYLTTQKAVIDNFEYAKEVYKKVFLGFASGYYEVYGKLPPEYLKKLEIT